MLLACSAENSGCEGKDGGKSMLASVTVVEVVNVAMTCPNSKDL